MRRSVPVLLLLFTCSWLHSGDWPHWRGPTYNGSAGSEDIGVKLKDWGSVRWRANLPGIGSSTPIVTGDSIFLTCQEPKTMELVAVCIARATGKTRWTLPGGTAKELATSNMATPSAVTDGKNVFFMFGNGEFFGTDLDGKEIWRRNIEKEYGALRTRFGYSSTPLLYQGRLYVIVLRLDKENADPTPEQPARASYFMAVDPETGKTIWKHSRPCDARDESQEAYTSPLPFEHGDRREILILGGDCLTGHNPDTGEELWRWKGYNPKRITVGRVITSPVVAGDLVVVCGPRHKRVFAVRPGKEGELGADAVAWEMNTRGSDSVTPLYHNGLLYLMNGQYGSVTAIRPEDGSVIWKEKLEFGAATKASPTGVGKHIYNIDESGHVFAIRAGKSFKLLEKKSLGGKLCRASIAIAGDGLIIRRSDRLYHIGKGR